MKWPTIIVKSAAMVTTGSAMPIVRRWTSGSLPRRRCQAETPITTMPAVISAAKIVCAKAYSAVLLVSTAQIEVSWALPPTIS